MSSPSFTDQFHPLAQDYDVVLSDVWGVVHNGVAATAEACDALTRFRAQGGTVVLITNAPRPGEIVVRKTLDPLKVPHAAYDGIVSSGDVTHALIAARAGQRVFHIGPPRDIGIFEGLNAPVAPLEQADYAVCSGLTDDTRETPEDYRPLIASTRPRSAGRVLAIGDSVRTDLMGAAAFGIDCLFVTAGIHAEELGARDNPDAGALGGIFASAGVYPKAVMRRLAW